MGRPETRYAAAPDGVRLAYQVVGDGDLDLVFVMGWMTNVDAMWEEPRLAAFLDRLASSARVIVIEKRGMGLSDRVPLDPAPSLATRVEDLLAVADAAGSREAIVMGTSESGPLVTLYAASHPDRTAGLILDGARARYGEVASDYPFGYPDDEFEAYTADTRERWATPALAAEWAAWIAPSRADDAPFAEWLASFMRRAGTGEAMAAFNHVSRTFDVRGVLGSIAGPTLVLSRTGDDVCPADETAWLASRIPGARTAVFDGADHAIWCGDAPGILDQIEAFAADVRARRPGSTASRPG